MDDIPIRVAGLRVFSSSLSAKGQGGNGLRISEHLVPTGDWEAVKRAQSVHRVPPQLRSRSILSRQRACYRALLDPIKR